MIKVLPAQVVNQIAAGEVIERPFSVVKELVENSLDAGARRITVELEDGGCRLIRVTDDGAGFSPEDLQLAFVSHATSKLADLQDLDHITSLGFRGEALASIAAVSKALIKSRQPDSDSDSKRSDSKRSDSKRSDSKRSGHELSCHGGVLEESKPCGCPVGTSLEIRDLFFNTPARRRFLRTARAEKAKCQELLLRLTLTRLDVDFTLQADNKEVLRLPAGESLKDRVARAFGRHLTAHLLPVKHQAGDYLVEGLVADPDLARRDHSQELLYINGRCAKDRSAGFAIRQAFKEYLMHGRHPVYFLSLWLPPDEVDVNVHPAKAEVRFVNQRLACGLLHSAVTRALASRGLQAQASAGAISVQGEQLPKASSGFPNLSADLFARPEAEVVHSPPPSYGEARVVEQVPANPLLGLQERRFLQVMDLYLVFEHDEGMVVVDQHALHERVLYERFKARDAQREIQVQRLLVPEVLELIPTDKAYLLDAAQELAQEGFLVQDFGGDSIAVQGIPALLGRANVQRLVETFLLGDGEQRPSGATAVVERFHSMACRAAVMSGDRLTEQEIQALLQESQHLQHPHNCPHGRPTTLTFSSSELERFFRRRL